MLERKPRFDWHPGMMLPTAHLQTPFLADLVTLADPTSRFSFLAYLKDTGRLYSFYIREDFFVLRSEYVAYCRWAAERARGIELDRDVRAVAFDEAEGAYVVESVDAAGAAHVHRGRNLVVGVGTPPWLPEAVRDLPGVVHSSGYLGAKAALQERDAITVVGSGQSAAEIYRDLLEDVDSRGYRLDWITRSPRFFPLEYTRLTLEMTSPEYSDHFFGLPADARDVLLREQRNLYKGIDSELIDEIFQTLYRKRLAFDALRAEGRLAAGGDAGSGVPTRLLTNAEVVSSRSTPDGVAVLGLRHAETGAERDWPTGAVIMASGYDARARGSSTASATACTATRGAASTWRASTRSTAPARSSCRTRRCTRTASSRPTSA
ncbi:L-lysine N6-monooxygenase [Clavibacter michiganensis subsp. michiganensis]|nr:L-lysine N6-monooxygenase [Clavibacter michiganensis subsp. michiganensis]